MLTSRPTSAAISSTSSSESDWVTVLGAPRPISIVISFGTGTPSAWERSLTVMPDSTVTGPVGGATGVFSFGLTSVRSRAWRPSWRGRAAPVSITTRRLRRPPVAPWRGRIGRLGLFGRSAIRVSVDPCQLGIDPHPLPQRAVEGAPRGRPLEAGQAPARVDTPAGALGRGGEHPVVRHEPQELGLGRLPPAACAGSDRVAHGSICDARPAEGRVGA